MNGTGCNQIFTQIDETNNYDVVQPLTGPEELTTEYKYYEHMFVKCLEIFHFGKPHSVSPKTCLRAAYRNRYRSISIVSILY